MKNLKLNDEGQMLALEMFMGTKTIHAQSMTLGEYNKFKGWTIPENEDPNKEGYVVMYSDNYVSWSPKEAFVDAYRTNGNLTFGQAIEAAKQGRRVARLGWNGKGLFVFMQIPAVIQEEIIPKMQSLPQTVKDEFAKRGGSISYQNQFGIVYPDNSIHGWTPSPSDTLAEDWVILD